MSKWMEDYEQGLKAQIKYQKILISQLRHRIATLEAMVQEALRVFDLHLNTPETRALETYKLPVDSKSLLDQLAEKDSRIAELKADIDGLLEGAGATERGFSKRIAELEAWKASALSVMPDFQAISKTLGLKLGIDVSPQILPRIKAMTELLDAVSNLEHHEFKRRWDELKGQP